MSLGARRVPRVQGFLAQARESSGSIAWTPFEKMVQIGCQAKMGPWLFAHCTRLSIASEFEPGVGMC
jgi:hypothetical protein